MNSPVFLDGINEGEICEVEVEEGKVFIIKLVEIGKVSKDGVRRVTFEVNGNTREIIIMDEKYKHRKPSDNTLWADPDKRDRSQHPGLARS